ncbi:MAG: copper chaperone PCu(A)C [Rhodospirillaceae bacterium]
MAVFRDVVLCLAASALLHAGGSAIAADSRQDSAGASGEALPAPKIEDIEVVGAWARAARRGETAHIFVTVRNNGPVAAHLRGGETDIGADVRLVSFKTQGPFYRASLVDPIPVAAHGQFAFEPGVAALEIWNLKEDLREGTVVPIILLFSDAGTLQTKVEIDSRTAVRYSEPPPPPSGKANPH